MSATEIYIRRKSTNNWQYVGRARNAWNGSMHIWRKLEEKYLINFKYIAPKEYEYFIKGMTHNGTKDVYVHRIDCQFMSIGERLEDNPAYELWNLDKNVDIPITYEETMVLRSTLDWSYIPGNQLNEFATCLDIIYEEIGGNLNEQAKVIRDAVDEYGDDIEAVWINATSVNCVSDWLGSNEDEPLDNGKFWNIMQTRDEYIQWREELTNDVIERSACC